MLTEAWERLEEHQRKASLEDGLRRIDTLETRVAAILVSLEILRRLADYNREATRIWEPKSCSNSIVKRAKGEAGNVS